MFVKGDLLAYYAENCGSYTSGKQTLIDTLLAYLLCTYSGPKNVIQSTNGMTGNIFPLHFVQDLEYIAPALQMGFGFVPGSKSFVHIKENAEIFDFELTAEEMERIASLNKHEPFYKVTPESLQRLATTKCNFED